MNEVTSNLIEALQLGLVKLKLDLLNCPEDYKIKVAIDSAEQAIYLAKNPSQKKRIRQNIWGNINGYIGTRKIKEFGCDSLAAEDWMKE